MEKELITVKVCNEINKLLKNDSIINESSPLLGDHSILDSITAINLVVWCNETYNIDLLSDDLNLDFLNNIGTLINCIYDKTT